MSVKGTQRNATRNQSTVDIVRENLFLSGNRYQTGVFINDSGSTATFSTGSLVLRDTTVANQIKPAIADATLVNVIGILNVNGSIELVDDGTFNANYAVCGDVDAGLLSLPSGVTLDTVTTGAAKNLRDILTDLGFILHNVTEQSKTAN